MTDYEVSASYFDALLRALGWQALPAVLEALDPASRPTIHNVWSEPWHPAIHLEAFGAAVVTVSGPEGFEELAYRATKDRFGPIVLPMLKRSLETTNRSPAAILSKLGSTIEVAIRGMNIVWTPAGVDGGQLAIMYPRRVAAHVGFSWRGVLRFVFEVTQSTGRITDFLHTSTGQILQYRLKW